MPNFPPRKPNAISGSQVIQKIMSFKTDSPARSKIILDEFASGNIPSFLRKFVPVNIKSGENEITYFVSPDYMSVGSDSDYVRMSLNGEASQDLADMFNCVLPTKKMVDDIHSQAQTKLPPAAMSGGATVSGKHYSGKEFINEKMQHADSLEEHNRMIQRQLARDKNYKPGNLVAGNKKDIIIGDLLAQRPDRVNIYGWHYENGKAIQPNSTIHERAYQDYSHAVRLVDRTCIVKVGNSQPVQMDITKVMKDKALSGLVSHQGPVKFTSYNELPTKRLSETKPEKVEQEDKKEIQPEQESTKEQTQPVKVSPKILEILNNFLSKLG